MKKFQALQGRQKCDSRGSGAYGKNGGDDSAREKECREAGFQPPAKTDPELATPDLRWKNKTCHAMKFCYVDESGKGDEPILVMTGIVADIHLSNGVQDSVKSRQLEWRVLELW